MLLANPMDDDIGTLIGVKGQPLHGKSSNGKKFQTKINTIDHFDIANKLLFQKV